jgi:hypothetical protein
VAGQQGGVRQLTGVQVRPLVHFALKGQSREICNY